MMYDSRAAPVGKYLNMSSASRLYNIKDDLPSTRTIRRPLWPSLLAKVFVAFSVVVVPEKQVSLEQLSDQTWPELQRTTSADMNTKLQSIYNQN